MDKVSLVSKIFALNTILCFAGVASTTEELLKAYQNCPEGQFFEIETGSYRKCDTFCKNGTGTASCQRQCAVYFLKIENERKDRANEEKFSKLENEIKVLKESVSTQQSSFQPVNVLVVITITVVTMVICIIAGWCVRRYKPHCFHSHTIPKHDPENAEYPRPNQSSGTDNRNFNNRQPQNDRRQEEIRIEIGTAVGPPANA